jgi:hypothetical protein
MAHSRLLFLLGLGPLSSSTDKMAHCRFLFLLGLGPVSSSTDKMAHCQLLFLFGCCGFRFQFDLAGYSRLSTDNVWTAEPPSDSFWSSLFVCLAAHSSVETDSRMDKLPHTCALFRNILIPTCPPWPLSVLSKCTPRKLVTAFSENCYQPELNTWNWMEQRNSRKTEKLNSQATGQASVPTVMLPNSFLVSAVPTYFCDSLASVDGTKGWRSR